MEGLVYQQLSENADALVTLLAAKSTDYGRAVELLGRRNVAYRLQEKVCRLLNIVDVAQPQTPEPIRETLQDIAGIALLAATYIDMDRLSLDGNWKECMAWTQS